MNILESQWITRRKNNWGEDLWEIQVLIDGRDLIDMVKVYELTIGVGEELAGAYSGISPRSIPDETESLTRWMGMYTDEHYLGRKTLLLGCGSCDFPDCWPLLVSIERDRETTLWSNFEQPHRDSSSSDFWDYANFGPFIFENESYTQALEQLFSSLKRGKV